MKVLLTGAMGFLGRNLTEKLLELGHVVYAISREPGMQTHKNLVEIKMDLLNIDQLIIDTPIDVIYHTAARVNFDNSKEAIYKMTDDNIFAALSLGEFVIKNKIKKVVISSSCSVYDLNFEVNTIVDENYPLRPQNLYAVTKLSAEWILANKLINVCDELMILRYSSIYGVGQRENSILPKFITDAYAGNPIRIFGTGQRIQDYVYIDDVIAANISCLNMKEHQYNCIYNIGSGERVSDFYLASKIKEIWDSTSQIEILSKSMKHEIFMNYSINKALANALYTPTSLEEGLKLYHNKYIAD